MMTNNHQRICHETGQCVCGAAEIAYLTATNRAPSKPDLHRYDIKLLRATIARVTGPQEQKAVS